jgi:hypothetical protein
MKINGFKLVDFGRKGIKITTEENVVKDGMTIVDEVERHRQVPVPDSLRKKIQELKKVFMQICMYWVPEFDVLWDGDVCEPRIVNKMDREYERLVHLLQCIQINGVKIVGNRFMIMAQITVSDNGQVISPTVPLLGPDDSIFYDETWEKIMEIKKEIKSYLDSAKLNIDAKQYLLPLYSKNEDDLNNMTDAEAEKQAIELLQDKGFVVISGEEVMNPGDDESKTEENDGGDTTGIVKEEKKKKKKKNELPALAGESEEKVRRKVVKDKFPPDTF